MYSITWLWGYNRYLCSNPLRGCIPLLGCEVTTGISIRTHCVNVFHYLDVRLQRVSLFEPTVWMYSITWLWGYNRYLCSNQLFGCIPLLGCEVTTGISVRTNCMDVFHYLALRLQQVSLFEPTAWMYSITWMWGYNRYLCSNPLYECIPLLGCEVITGISVRTHCVDVFHYMAIPLLGCEVTTGISVRTHCMDVFHYLAVRLQQVSLFEPTTWMYSITWLWGYNMYLCSNPLYGCIPLLGCEVTTGISVRTHYVDVFHYLDVRLQHVSLFEPTAWMYSITCMWGYNRYLCSNPLYECIPLLGCEVITGISVRTHCVDVFHYLAVRLQQVSLFEPTVWMYSITCLWGYNRYLCSNPLRGCIPLLGCEVTAGISVRTHCVDVFHYLAVRLQQVSLFEPASWMHSITWMWGYIGYLCSNPLRGCIPLLGCEVTTGISIRTHCMDVFHYLAVRLQQVSLFEPTVWMYSITWLWGYNRYLCSNPLRGCIPLLGCEVTAGISVRTNCMDVFHYLPVRLQQVWTHYVDVFHYLAVRLQQVSLFEPTVWMYSITWLWGYNMYLCSNQLRGCIPLLGCEVTIGIPVRIHGVDVFHYLAIPLLGCEVTTGTSTEHRWCNQLPTTPRQNIGGVISYLPHLNRTSVV